MSYLQASQMSTGKGNSGEAIWLVCSGADKFVVGADKFVVGADRPKADPKQTKSRLEIALPAAIFGGVTGLQGSWLSGGRTKRRALLRQRARAASSVGASCSNALYSCCTCTSSPGKSSQSGVTTGIPGRCDRSPDVFAF